MEGIGKEGNNKYKHDREYDPHDHGDWCLVRDVFWCSCASIISFIVGLYNPSLIISDMIASRCSGKHWKCSDWQCYVVRYVLIRNWRRWSCRSRRSDRSVQFNSLLVAGTERFLWEWTCVACELVWLGKWWRWFAFQESTPGASCHPTDTGFLQR
jgi:hypothetical protein